MKKGYIMYAKVTPDNANEESKLIKSGLALQPEIGRRFGFPVGFEPGKGISIIVPKESMEAHIIPEDDLRLILTAFGVRILKEAKIKGSVDIKF